MPRTNWPHPRHTWGRDDKKVPVAYKVTPAVRAAVQEKARLETQRSGRRVAQGTILAQLAMDADQELHDLHDRYLNDLKAASPKTPAPKN